MFEWLKRKIKGPKYISAIEETDAAWNECRELQRKHGWSEEKFDEELDNRIEMNANAYVNRRYGKVK